MRLSSSVTGAGWGGAGAAVGVGVGVGVGAAMAGLGAATGFLAATRFLATTRFLAARTGFFAATRRLGAFAAFFFATTRDLAVFAAFFLAAGLLEPDFFFLAAMGISQRLRNSIAPGGFRQSPTRCRLLASRGRSSIKGRWTSSSRTAPRSE